LEEKLGIFIGKQNKWFARMKRKMKCHARIVSGFKLNLKMPTRASLATNT